MLRSISCEKLVETPIIFKGGLNAVVGADDAHNSIGKSSILMLIDFVFGGGDFPSKCDDVIRNVGHFKVGFELEFEKIYSFIRDTENTENIYRVSEQDYISLKEFNNFLKSKYLPKEDEVSFRESVSGFFRIYQRKNFDDGRPLDIIKKDKWVSIRKRTLKIFGKYWTISDLEKEVSIEQKKQKDIKGTFSSGAVKKITKARFKINESEIQEVSIEVESVKEALKKNVTDIKSIINERNLALKKEKDSLVELKAGLQQHLYRIESNLSDNKVRNSKSYQEVVEYFPNIDADKLAKVEGFHKGITAILKKQLQDEKEILISGIDIADEGISKVDSELLEIVNSEEGAVYLLERLMELDRLKRDLVQQNEFQSRGSEVQSDIDKLKNGIEKSLVDSIGEIENVLNSGMKKYIEIIYPDKPILPKIILGKTDYKFDHGDDRGTGKGYANMIALDLTFLESTHLPCLIHDSLLFKNMDVPAVEHLIGIYDSFDKQIFVSIDEVSKYCNKAQVLINNAMFLKLDHDRLAFIVRWKKRNE
jgi:hypothetical protein